MITSFILTNFILPLILVVIVPLFIHFILLPYKAIESKKNKEIGTYFYPIHGIFHQWNKDYIKLHDSMASTKMASKNFPNQKALVTNVSARVMIMLRDTQYAKEFSLKNNLYKKSSHGDVMKSLLGTSLVFAEGDLWKRNRRIISNHFHYEFLKANVSVMQGTTKEFLNKVKAEEYENFPALMRFQEITGEIVGRIFFGESFNSYTFAGKQLTLALANIMAELGTASRATLPMLFGPKVMEYPIFPKLKKVSDKVKGFRQVCFDIIQDRKKNQSYKGYDLLNSLLETQKSEDLDQRFSDLDIVNEFVNFFAAGMDSTALLVGMTLYSLANNPQYQTSLKEERDRYYNKGEEMTTDLLSKMEFLHAVLKETLRFYAPVFQTIIREAISDHKLGDLEIKKGDYVTNDFFALMFNENYFANPLEYNPNRWMDPQQQKVDPYVYTPFSAGPRNCNGQHLAIMEAKVIVSEFLEKFEFEVSEKFELRMVVKVLYQPDDELRLKIRPITGLEK